MKVSAFTFIRNGQQLGFPYIQSIKSVLPIVDEFIINVGNSQDDTLAKLQEINNPKIKLINTVWNDHMQSRGFVYGQQKMIAQYSCTGDWIFYIEGDELIHEQDYENIISAMKKHLHNPKVEALVFDYIHFYGNINTYIWTPAFCRRAPRIIKSSVRSYAPDGLFWVVLDKKNKQGRYPNAALVNAPMYHYGWVRHESQMIEKLTQVEHFWSKKDQARGFSYMNIDAHTLHCYEGSHPAALDNFFAASENIFIPNKEHVLTKRERKNRFGLKLEKWFGLDFSRKHFTLIK